MISKPSSAKGKSVEVLPLTLVIPLEHLKVVGSQQELKCAIVLG